MAEPHKVTLVFVAGFLGAGKTTLLLQSAKMLVERGRRVALLTNDQSSHLVDTELAKAEGFATGEITGGCFCCRFSDLVIRLEDLARYEPEIIFAEPVGSCADLSATIFQPLKALYSERFRLAPLTVLVDPVTARIMNERPGSLTAYLFRKQLAEADLVCLNKIDLYGTDAAISEGIDFFISAETGAGIAEWLNMALAGGGVAGAKLLDIDYNAYAAAEGSLGWLNWHAQLELHEPMSAAVILGPLLDSLDSALTGNGIAIWHCKLLDRTGTGVLKASICRNGEYPQIRGDLNAPGASSHEITLNLRAESDPEKLREIVAQRTSALPGTLALRICEAFRPLPPKPEHRYTYVVS